jgi:hypothetical protein
MKWLKCFKNFENASGNSSTAGMGGVSSPGVSSTSVSASTPGSGDLGFTFKEKSRKRKKGNPSEVSDLRDLEVDVLSKNESLTLSQYREWSKHANMEFYDEMGKYFKTFTNHSNNYNRIYFDLEVDTDDFEMVIPDEIADFFNWYGYDIIDYQKGICRDKDGREIRIGKLLNRLGEDRLLKTYNNSKQNTLKNIDDLQVVISRHPYDIIGMSTDRGWTTCHDLDDKRYDGRHLYGLKYNLQNGVLVAYVIRKDDRNIKNPISRCLISRGVSDLFVDDSVYGTNVPGFRDFLNDWVDDYKSKSI